MQVQPDWDKSYASAEEFTQDLNGLEFTGPGFYLTRTDTLLAVMEPPECWARSLNPWCPMGWPKGTRIHVHVWNQPHWQTIFAQVAVAPVRSDRR